MSAFGVCDNPLSAHRSDRNAGIAIAALALFIVLAVVHTWPLASAPGRYSRNDNADTLLNEWTIAWVAHQVVRDPLHLFDANIFYPERRTLAFSEHLFVQSMMAAPLLWMGASPVLAHNLLLIAGFALTGWATALVVRRWTGSWLAGIMSGSLMAFNAHTLTRLPHIQAQHLEFFPFVLLALDKLLVTPRKEHAVQLAGWYVLQSLTSMYFLVFTTIAMIASVLARPAEWLRGNFRALFPQAALAAALSAAALTPFLLPYWQNRQELAVFGRSLRDVTRYSARLTDYLATGGTWHFELWSRQFFHGDALFPGVTAIGLTIAVIASGLAISDRRARMALAFGSIAFALSFGPAFPLYTWLYQTFPLMMAIRAAVRFGQIFLAAIAILAGFGLVVLQRRLGRRWALPVCVALVLGANLEALRAPINYCGVSARCEAFQGVPRIFRTLDTPEPAVIVMFPFHRPGRLFLNGRYMLVSTAFWKPMLNGYSGYMPTSYIAHTRALSGFPDAASIKYLRELGVTRVLVDSRNMGRADLARLPDFPELSPMVTDGNLRIYVLKR